MKILTTIVFLLLLFSCATIPEPLHKEDYLLALNSIMQFPNFISNEQYISCEFATNISKQTFQFTYNDNGLMEQIAVNRTFTEQETSSPYTVDLFWDDNNRLVKTEMKTVVNEQEYFLIVEFFYSNRSSYTLDHIIENNGSVIQYKKITYQQNLLTTIESFFINTFHEKPTDSDSPFRITSIESEKGVITKIIHKETSAGKLHSLQTFTYNRNSKDKILGFTATQQVFDETNQKQYAPITYTAVFN